MNVLPQWEKAGNLLRDVVRLDSLLFLLDYHGGRSITVLPTWRSVCDARFLLAPDVTEAATRLAHDGQNEQELLFGVEAPPHVDPTVPAPPSRLMREGSALWTACVEDASLDPGVQRLVRALSRAVGETLTPDAPAVRIRPATEDEGEGLQYEIALQYGITPQSKSVTPPAILVPRGEDEDALVRPLQAPMLERFYAIEESLLQALAWSLDQYRQRTRAEETRALNTR